MQNYNIGIQKLIDFLGEDKVITDEEILTQSVFATFAATQKIITVIRPSSPDDIQVAIKVANEYDLKLYPISGGKSWGLGSKLPYVDGAILLDLKSLNQISNYDPVLGTVTLQAGVTFYQLFQFLEKHESNFFSPVIGGPKDASILGNLLERGDRVNSSEDRIGCMSNLEVLLPNGDLIHTGFGQYKDAVIQSVHPWAVGPYIDGLFTQSSFGVVTAATISLQKKPAYMVEIGFFVKETASLANVVNSLRELAQQNILRANSLSIWNSYKTASVEHRFPEGLVKADSPDLKKLNFKEYWGGGSVMFAPNAEVAAALAKVVNEALKDHVRVLHISQPINTVKYKSLFLGHPTDDRIRSAYCRKPYSITDLTLDPDRDQCGFLWICPAFPFEGSVVADQLSELESIIKDHQFEPAIGFMAVTDKVLHVFVSIAFDREIEGEDERAMCCHDIVMEKLIANGFYPSRLGIQFGLDRLPSGDDATKRFLKTLSDVVDPKSVLATGKYCL